MKQNKYLMESLDEYLNEGDYVDTNEGNIHATLTRIIEGFGIDIDEIYSQSAKDGIYKMAEKLNKAEFERHGFNYN